MSEAFYILSLFFFCDLEIGQSNADDAAEHIADRDEKQIAEIAADRQPCNAVAKKTDHNKRHIGNAVFKADRDKGEKTPEDHDKLARFRFHFAAAPDAKADENIAEKTAEASFL